MDAKFKDDVIIHAGTAQEKKVSELGGGSNLVVKILVTAEEAKGGDDYTVTSDTEPEDIVAAFESGAQVICKATVIYDTSVTPVYADLYTLNYAVNYNGITSITTNKIYLTADPSGNYHCYLDQINYRTGDGWTYLEKEITIS